MYKNNRWKELKDELATRASLMMTDEGSATEADRRSTVLVLVQSAEPEERREEAEPRLCIFWVFTRIMTDLIDLLCQFSGKDVGLIYRRQYFFGF